MKRFLAVFLTLLTLLALLAGCGEGKTTSAPSPDGTNSSESKTEASVSDVPSSPDKTATPTPETSEVSESTPTPTPSSTPTLTPTPTPPPTVAAGMTEEEMNVLPVGQYTIVPKGSDKGLSYANTESNNRVDIPVTVGGELNTFTIVYQTHKEDPYYLVFAGEDSMHVLAPEGFLSPKITDKLVFVGKARQSSETASTKYFDDKRESIQWHITENEDGTYTFSNNQYDSWLLSYKDGELCMEEQDKATGITSFELKMEQRGGGKAFLQYISDEGNVVVRVPSDIFMRVKKLTDEMLQIWANNLDDAYNSYIELTSFVAYESIVVKAYEPSPHIGYVWNDNSHYNVITIEKSFMVTDLGKMAMRSKKYGVVDWNFCALHEMGHMFDNQQPWYFEAEMMTDLKVAYVLEKNGACAAPSEFNSTDYFYADRNAEHAQVEECYRKLSKNGVGIAESLEYGAYSAALKFVEIQRQIDDENWTVFKQAYAELRQEGITTYKKYERFENFVQKLSDISGKDVRALFTDAEWNVYMTKYGYTG